MREGEQNNLNYLPFTYPEVSFDGELQKSGSLPSTGHGSENGWQQDSLTVTPLNPDASISASDFEKKWTDLPVA